MNTSYWLLIIGSIIALSACGNTKNTSNNNNFSYSIFTDNRDGKQYKTLKLANQEWFAENLSYQSENSYCYKDKDKSCEDLGRLYTWEAALTACPSGWHLPSDEEWKQLSETLGGFYDREATNAVGNPREGYKQLMKGGKSGFNALLGGYRSESGSYTNLDAIGYYWTSTEVSILGAWNYRFVDQNDMITRFSYDMGNAKAHAYSCRCVKD